MYNFLEFVSRLFVPPPPPSRLDTFRAVGEALQPWVVIVGLGLTVVALFINFSRTRAMWESVATNSRRNVKELKAARKQRQMDRFSKGIELLSDAKLPTRIGGVHLFERLAVARPRDRQRVIQILVTFLKQRSKQTIKEKKVLPTADIVAIEPAAARGNYWNRREDMQAALETVLLLHGRSEPLDPTSEDLLDLRYCSLSDLRLSRGATVLRDIDFIDSLLGGAKVSGVRFINCDFRRCIVMGLNRLSYDFSHLGRKL